MKKVITLIAVLSFSILNGQKTYVPDDAFENFLEYHDRNLDPVIIGDPSSLGDGILNNDSVLTARIDSVTFLDISSLGISDLTGIDSFELLKNLYIVNNNFDSLVFSSHLSLTSLSCSYNQINHLDISNLVTLQELYTVSAFGPNFDTLDVKSNTALTLSLIHI